MLVHRTVEDIRFEVALALINQYGQSAVTDPEGVCQATLVISKMIFDREPEEIKP